TPPPTPPRFGEGLGVGFRPPRSGGSAVAFAQQQQDRAPTLDPVADLDAGFADHLGRHEHFGARAELDHAEAFALDDLLADAQPADDAAGDRSGDLLDAEGAAEQGVFEIDPELFVPRGAVGVAGVE